MAGECLGELGAVDPYAISFSFKGQSELHPALSLDRKTNDQQIASAKVTHCLKQKLLGIDIFNSQRFLRC